MYPARRFTLFQAHLFPPPSRRRQRRSCHLPNLPRQPPNCLQKKALRRLLSRFLLVRLHTRLLLRRLPRGRHHPRRRALLGVGSLGLESAPLIGYPRSGMPQQRRAAAGSSPSSCGVSGIRRVACSTSWSGVVRCVIVVLVVAFLRPAYNYYDCCCRAVRARLVRCTVVMSGSARPTTTPSALAQTTGRHRCWCAYPRLRSSQPSSSLAGSTPKRRSTSVRVTTSTPAPSVSVM